MFKVWSKVKEVLSPGSKYLYADIGKDAIPQPKAFRYPSPAYEAFMLFLPSRSQPKYDFPLNYPKKTESLAKGYYFQRDNINKAQAALPSSSEFHGWVKLEKPNSDIYNLKKWVEKDDLPSTPKHFHPTLYKQQNAAYEDSQD
jgi:hypothetical protein